MDKQLIEVLRGVDTPTVCNAIEVVEGKRGFDRFTRGTVLCTEPKAGAIVGYACTAKISAVAPPEEPADVIKARRMDYYRHMASGPRPALAVIEDVDGDRAIGAFWGEINTNVHKGLGLSGAITNGVMRDLGDLPEGFPVIAGSIGPSHGFVHVLEIARPVTVFELEISDGEVVHADQHGAVVIPADYTAEIAATIDKLISTEHIVLDAAKEPDFNFEKFEIAWSAFEKSRT